MTLSHYYCRELSSIAFEIPILSILRIDTTSWPVHLSRGSTPVAAADSLAPNPGPAFLFRRRQITVDGSALRLQMLPSSGKRDCLG